MGEERFGFVFDVEGAHVDGVGGVADYVSALLLSAVFGVDEDPDALAAYIRSRARTRGRWREHQAPERERLIAEGRRWLNEHGEPFTSAWWRNLQDSSGSPPYPSLQAIRAHFGGFPAFSEAVETQPPTSP